MFFPNRCVSRCCGACRLSRCGACYRKWHKIRYKSEYSFTVRREGLIHARGHADEVFLSTTIKVALFLDVQIENVFFPCLHCNQTALALCLPAEHSVLERVHRAGYPTLPFRVKSARACLGSHLALCSWLFMCALSQQSSLSSSACLQGAVGTGLEADPEWV